MMSKLRGKNYATASHTSDTGGVFYWCIPFYRQIWGSWFCSPTSSAQTGQSRCRRPSAICWRRCGRRSGSCRAPCSRSRTRQTCTAPFPWSFGWHLHTLGRCLRRLHSGNSPYHTPRSLYLPYPAWTIWHSVWYSFRACQKCLLNQATRLMIVIMKYCKKKLLQEQQRKKCELKHRNWLLAAWG